MTIHRRSGLLAVVLALSLPGLAAAHAPDARAIEHVMKRQFDRPDAPLAVQPVVVEGDFAMAGWTQQARGGRALLRRDKGAWSIVVCGGDGLLQSNALVHTGMQAPAAGRLVAAVKAAEAKLKPEQVKLFSTFEGIVKVDAAHGGHPAHGAAASHPSHKK